MKIGIDCRLWNETGVGRYIRNLVTELADIDKENEFVLFFKKEEYETYALPGKNFTKKLAEVRWHTFKEQTAFKNILEKEKLDVVHFPYFSYPVGYKGKFVITIHDLIIDHFPTGKASTLWSPVYFFKQLGYKFVLRSGVKHAQKIITVSGATKQEIIDHYHPNPENVVVTPEGIDRKFLEEKEEKVDIPERYFLYVGNVYPHKNVDRLVEAFSQFIKEHQDAHLILVGKEDFFSKQLEERIIKEKLHNILFYKHITDTQLSYLYTHAIALVAPSLMEGFGLPILEAMAHKCLVVASEIPAFLEVAGESAVYFDPYNVQDIANVLSLAYNKKIKDVMKKKESGLKRAKDFSWKKMAKETLGIYKYCS